MLLITRFVIMTIVCNTYLGFSTAIHQILNRLFSQFVIIATLYSWFADVPLCSYFRICSHALNFCFLATLVCLLWIEVSSWFKYLLSRGANHWFFLYTFLKIILMHTKITYKITIQKSQENSKKNYENHWKQAWINVS